MRVNVAPGIVNALCFDIDDLAYGLNMRNGTHLPYGGLVEKETYVLLESLVKMDIRATMFVPGYVARRYPGVVREIGRAGHEVASHGYTHMTAERLGRKGFREDASMSKSMLEDLLSAEVSTYKAPEWSITPCTPWAYDELISVGYRVDHTAQPALLKSLGRLPDDMEPFTYKDSLTVIPVTSCRLFGRDFPLNGGLFCAYVPISAQIRHYRRLNRKGVPFNYYCHPFEIHPQGANKHPWKYGSVWAAFYGIYFGIYRHHLSHLAEQFRFAPLKTAYRAYLPSMNDASSLYRYASGNGFPA
ncbi:MAG TPA: polysaccharide deacetylase family protein [Syntrophorhabdaceae bacterium]